LLGNYYFQADAPPQKYMRDFVMKRLGSAVDHHAMILEVGPGNHPIFSFDEYGNWYAVDKFYDGSGILFGTRSWARNAYPGDRIYTGGWENLSSIRELKPHRNGFDLIVASHSYEHVFKPIQSLIEAGIMLKPGGYIFLFVPDGFSDDPSSRREPSHTLYLVPEMIEEFFWYSGQFTKPEIGVFRPNADYYVVAQKKK